MSSKKHVLEPSSLQALKSLDSGDGDFLRGLFEHLSRDTPVRLESVRQSLESGEMETIQRECHTLKSALGQMAAIQAATHARTLEAAAREKLPLSDLRIIYEALTLEWSEVQKAWIKVLGEFS